MFARIAFGDSSRATRSPNRTNDLRPVDFTDSATERRLDGLAEDRELFESLAEQGYQGATWIAFNRALAEYGYQILFAWCLSGKIFVECARRGFGSLKRPPRAIDCDDASELAGETVAASLLHFRDHILVPKIWDPARGTALKTFFVGTCVLMFANVYRRWMLENGELSFSADNSGPAPAGSSNAVLACELDRLLSSLAPPDRELLRLAALGHTQLEVANLLGTTSKAVERRLGRLRRRLSSSI